MVQDGEQLEVDYNVMIDELMRWIEMKSAELAKRDLPNSLEGIQQLMTAFTAYRTKEKPPK